MKPKEKALQNLVLAYKDKGWKAVDHYEFDFHRFLIEEVAPHLSIKGMDILKDWYDDLNKQAKEMDECRRLIEKEKK